MVNLLRYFPSQIAIGSNTLKLSMNSLCSSLLWTTRSMQDCLVHYLEDHPVTLQINKWSKWKKNRIEKDEKHAKWVVGRLNIWVPELREKQKVLVNISEGQLAPIKIRNNVCIVLEGENVYWVYVKNSGERIH